jgi:hypothetical protein
MQQVFATAFAEEPPPSQSTGELAARAGRTLPNGGRWPPSTPGWTTCPRTLQMFMAGCPAGLEALAGQHIRAVTVVRHAVTLLAGPGRSSALPVGVPAAQTMMRV